MTTEGELKRELRELNQTIRTLYAQIDYQLARMPPLQRWMVQVRMWVTLKWIFLRFRLRQAML